MLTSQDAGITTVGGVACVWGLSLCACFYLRPCYSHVFLFFGGGMPWVLFGLLLGCAVGFLGGFFKSLWIRG